MTEKEQIYLAALLHDIGKFWQRTEWRRQFVPHAEQSADFMVEHFKDETLLRDLTRFHHVKDLKASTLTGKDRILAEIVYESDNLASMERERDVENFSEKRLVNVFSLIGKRNNAGNWQKTVEKTYQPLGRLNPAEQLYPMPTDESASKDRQVRDMWEQFSSEFKKEAANGANVTTLYYLCKKYLWCQSSAYWKNSPEISLFEHSRLTAAIATCIYDFLQPKINTIPSSDLSAAANNASKGNVLDRTEKRFLLVLADLSGIQDYIYNIAHDNALKALKGRSFYLQQLMDGVALQILNDLELQEAHLLFSGGGVFYLLLPNTDTAKKVLNDTERKVNEDILKTYHGVLSLNFAWDELCGNDFAPETIKNKWLDLKEKLLRRNKYRKMKERVGTDDFFTADELPYGGVKVCDATNMELVTIGEHTELSGHVLKGKYNLKFKEFAPAGHIKYYQPPDKSDEFEEEKNAEATYDLNKFISQEQFDSIRIGQRLKKKVDEVHFSIENKEFSIPGIELKMLPFDNEVDHIAPTILRAYKFNTDEFLSVNGRSKGWKFYGGNWFPKMDKKDGNQDTTASFEYLRDRTGVLIDSASEKRTGLRYLAVLRMDVDNLGDIFRNGLEKPPFSRIVQLSNMLDFFFSGYLNQLKGLRWDIHSGVNEHTGEQLEACIQIIYAGGDDLCIVGKWHVMPDVAFWIRERFAEFTGHNPSITGSAGIALFGAKYPLFKVADRAGEAEDKAKSYRRCLRKTKTAVEKDALCFLDNPLGWDDFQTVRQLARNFYEWITTGKTENGRTVKLPRGFLQLIQELFFEFSGGAGISDLSAGSIEANRYGRWRWLAAYRLSRMADRNKAFQNDIREMATDIFVGQKTNQEYLLILFTAAQWADFLTRENNTDDRQ